MVDDEVVAVIDAEALAAEFAGVVSGANAQEAKDNVMGSGKREGFAIALGLLDADALTGSGLTSEGDVGFPDHQAPGLDHTADAEDHCARAFGFDRFPQAAGA